MKCERILKTATVAVILAATLTGCTRSSASPRKSRPSDQVQTIDSVPPKPSIIDPPPVLTDEGPAPKPKGDLKSPDAPPPPSPQDEALRASLPFAPAIGLDPVDGTKISIRTTTPTVEYKNHIYYFASEATKRQFIASPEQYLKGPFAIPK